MKPFNMTGSARIGMLKASYPLATLTVHPEKLELNASIAGNLVFQPQDIISIEPYAPIPFLGGGIKIVHRVGNYASKVFFGSTQHPDALIERIKQTGFLDNMQADTFDIDADIVRKQEQGSFPIKPTVAIGFFVLFNFLFASDFFLSFLEGAPTLPFGTGMATAVSILLTATIFSFVSAEFRQLYLKEGRELKDIKKFLYFSLLIGAVMAINVLALVLMH